MKQSHKMVIEESYVSLCPSSGTDNVYISPEGSQRSSSPNWENESDNLRQLHQGAERETFKTDRSPSNFGHLVREI